jgi:hypothetical protein
VPDTAWQVAEPASKSAIECEVFNEADPHRDISGLQAGICRFGQQCECAGEPFAFRMET